MYPNVAGHIRNTAQKIRLHASIESSIYPYVFRYPHSIFKRFAYGTTVLSGERFYVKSHTFAGSHDPMIA